MVQDTRTLAEYLALFINLSKFARDYLADERKKYRLFQEGLNMSIKTRIKLHHFSNYFELVQAALEAKKIERDFSTRRQERSKRGGFHFSSPKIWF